MIGGRDRRKSGFGGYEKPFLRIRVRKVLK